MQARFAGALQKRRRRALRNDAAAMQDDDPVGRFGFVDEMGGPQDGHRAPVAQLEHVVQQVAPARRVEAHRGFVHEQEFRAVDQRPRELDPAALAAAEGPRTVPRAVGQAQMTQVLRDPRARLGARKAVQAGVKPQIAGDRHVEVQRRLLEHHAEAGERRHGVAADVAAVDGDFAAVGDEQAGEQLEQGGLAGAVGPEQRDELAGVDAQVDAVERLARPIGLDHLACVENRARRCLRRSVAHPSPPCSDGAPASPCNSERLAVNSAARKRSISGSSGSRGRGRDTTTSRITRDGARDRNRMRSPR